MYVHQNETVSTYITLHNKANENQAFTIEPLSIPEPLSTVGLPVTELLVPNHLKQVAFGISAPPTASFENLSVSFSITSDLDPAVNETVVMEVKIVPRSNLNFGVDDYATFTVDELVRTAVAVNISNNATLTDDVVFNLYTDSDWSWGWNMPDVNGNEAFTTLAAGTQAYVYLWVDVPAVVNGAPLAETGPRFILSAISGLDKDVETWTFDLLMNEKKNASIDELESSLMVAPNQDGRLQAVVRNVGNTANTLNITLRGLTANGDPLPDTPQADRFNASGWVVALFGGLENVLLQPNESRSIEIGFQAPNEFQGELHVELRVFAKVPHRASNSPNRGRHQSISSGRNYTRRGGLPRRPSQPSMHRQSRYPEHGERLQHLRGRETNTSGGFTVDVPASSRLLQVNQQGSTTTSASPHRAMRWRSRWVKPPSNCWMTRAWWWTAPRLSSKSHPKLLGRSETSPSRSMPRGVFPLRWKYETTAMQLTASSFSCSRVIPLTWASSRPTLLCTRKGLNSLGPSRSTTFR